MDETAEVSNVVPEATFINDVAEFVKGGAFLAGLHSDTFIAGTHTSP